MSIEKAFSIGGTYCHIYPFPLNTPESALLGESKTLPADSFLLTYTYGDESKRILIDTGKKGQGEHIIIPYFKKHHIQTIDYLFISHMHSDHYGGLIDLLNDASIDMKQIIYSPIPGKVIELKNAGSFPKWQELDALLKGNSERVTEISEKDVGSHYTIGPDLSFEVVAVPNLEKIESDVTQASINDLNVVLKMHYKKFTALFPGDCGVEQADEIMQSDKSKVIEDVFFLKVPHHGKTKVIPQEFFEKCNARLLVLTCNEQVTKNKDVFMSNLYDFTQSGAKVYRMDHYDDIQIYTNGDIVTCMGATNDFTEHTNFQL